MRLLKRALAVLGTVVLIATIAALVTPKTAHAVVATLVQVQNGPANPVPTSMATHLGQPSSNVVNLVSGFNFFSTNEALFSFTDDRTDSPTFSQQYVVPAGQKLVITDIEWSLCGPASSSVFWQLVDLSVGEGLIYPQEGGNIGSGGCVSGESYT
jgi:hypothetical protein